MFNPFKIQFLVIPLFFFDILLLILQHPYVYIVLVFEAIATFVGQVSVLSLVALFGAATTAMVILLSHSLSLKKALYDEE